ncbi:MAG: trehalose-6-phosphate synthase [Acidobacteriota bacterium]
MIDPLGVNPDAFVKRACGDSVELIVASNRLPVSLAVTNGGVLVRSSSGGLATALQPALAGVNAVWVGWPGATAEELSRDIFGLRRGLRTCEGASLSPVHLSDSEVASYYQAFSSGVLWPLFHELPEYVGTSTDGRARYQEVNRRFAQVLAAQGGAETPCWVHDYHLLSCGRHLRELAPRRRLGFFLHIPFPHPSALAEREDVKELLLDLLHYDVVGFQSEHDLHNFVEFVAEAEGIDSIESAGSGGYFLGGSQQLEARVFPIGIAAEDYASLALEAEIDGQRDQIERRFEGRKLLLGIDRLDYTKGIEEKLRAYAVLLESREELRGEVTLFQLGVPTRSGVHGYSALEQNVRQLAEEINQRFGHGDWKPVELKVGTVSRTELAALYRRADVCLVTSLRDGMNLVCKEFAACQLERQGVLVLSSKAGAADRLGAHSELVEPASRRSLVGGMSRAVDLPLVERRKRMTTLQSEVHAHDAAWWCDQFLAALLSPQEMQALA